MGQALLKVGSDPGTISTRSRDGRPRCHCLHRDGSSIAEGRVEAVQVTLVLDPPVRQMVVLDVTACTEMGQALLSELHVQTALVVAHFY